MQYTLRNRGDAVYLTVLHGPRLMRLALNGHHMEGFIIHIPYSTHDAPRTDIKAVHQLSRILLALHRLLCV